MQLNNLPYKPLFQHNLSTSNLAYPQKIIFEEYFRRALNKPNEVLELLEARLKEFHEVKYCFLFNSGFWALAVLIRSLVTQPHSYVAIPAFAYRKLSKIIRWSGNKTVLCDIEREGMSISLESISSFSDGKLAAIVAQHPVSSLCKINELVEYAEHEGITLIFDSVEAVGQKFSNRAIGGFGDAEVFSLGASKLINGFEGGYITTNSEYAASRIRTMIECKLSGASIQVPLKASHAALALSTLEDLQEQISKNKLRFKAYQKGLSKVVGLNLRAPNLETNPTYKNILVEINNLWPLTAKKTLEILHAENIRARLLYSPHLGASPLADHAVALPLPNTLWADGRYLLLPSNQLLSLDDIDKICEFLMAIQQHRFNVKKTI